MKGKLVSVIIASYNSARFIIETLESVAGQTWEEMELIVTDDCSGDNTVELCRNGLKNTVKDSFVQRSLHLKKYRCFS